jgi:nitroimidazol reductase NimA-like FMN-containing flavoprotein (pyridoxamine 5'-phosphate oxidase superfamily)
MNRMTVLTDAECRDHLEPGGVGRLAFVTSEGLRMVPLNFASNRSVLVFRTLADSELGRYGEGAEAVFEVDEIDEATETGWSVLAFGRLQRPSDLDESWDIHGWRNPTPWSGGERNFHLELRWHTLTGRRLHGPVQ